MTKRRSQRAKNTGCWVEPAKLLEQVNAERNDVPDDRYFNDPRYKRNREAWAAAKFGLALEQLGLYVRICTEEEGDIDFTLRINDKALPFQLTEVQQPGRKRGDEMRQRGEEPPIARPYRPERGRQEGPAWILAGVREKRHATGRHLLVYANFHASDLDSKEIYRRCKNYRQVFPSFWVMQNHRVIQMWSDELTSGWAEDWLWFKSDI